MIDTPVVPVASLILVAAAALVAAVLLGVQPGFRAARTPAAVALKDE